MRDGRDHCPNVRQSTYAARRHFLNLFIRLPWPALPWLLPPADAAPDADVAPLFPLQAALDAGALLLGTSSSENDSQTCSSRVTALLVSEYD